MNATAASAETRQVSFVTGLYEAMRDSMREEPRMTIIGAQVFGLRDNHLMDALRDEFPGRVMEPPVAEAALVTTAVGAAMAGAPTFLSVGTGTFSFPAWSSIFNEAAVVHHLSNGQLRAPIVLHIDRKSVV